MARGRRKPRRKVNGKFVPSHNEKKGKVKKEKEKMLDMGRVKTFRYDLEEILEQSKNEDNRQLFKANISIKASQLSIPEAKEYVDKLSENGLESEIAEKIKNLLERNSTYR